MNNALYRWALYGDSKESRVIKSNAPLILELHSLVRDKLALIRYANHVGTVVEEQAKTQKFIEKSLAIDTQSTINQLEVEYLELYVLTIKASEKNLYYVFSYAFFVLIIAIYLGLMLKKSYSTLKTRDYFRSQQINVAYRHLGYADANVEEIKNTFSNIKETLRYLGVIYQEAQKKNQDSNKIRSLLAQTLRKYRSLQKNKSFNQADELLNKSNKDLDRASELVKGLIVS